MDAKIFFAHKKLKKPTSKVAQNSSNPLFFLTAQTAQTEEFLFQNMAYWITVYRTGLKVHIGCQMKTEKCTEKL